MAANPDDLCRPYPGKPGCPVVHVGEGKVGVHAEDGVRTVLVCEEGTCPLEFEGVLGLHSSCVDDQHKSRSEKDGEYHDKSRPGGVGVRLDE